MRSVVLFRCLFNILDRVPRHVHVTPSHRVTINNGVRICQRLRELSCTAQGQNILTPKVNSRFTVKRYGRRTSNVTMDTEDEDLDDDEESDEFEDSEIPEFAEDKVAQGRTPKKMAIVLPGLRIDSVTAKCLNESRNEVENQFYSRNLYLNGKLVTKKNVMIKEGDYLDLHSKKSDTVMARRIRLLKILGTVTKNKKTKSKVSVLVWKAPFEVPDDYYNK